MLTFGSIGVKSTTITDAVTCAGTFEASRVRAA